MGNENVGPTANMRNEKEEPTLQATVLNLVPEQEQDRKNTGKRPNTFKGETGYKKGTEDISDNNDIIVISANSFDDRDLVRLGLNDNMLKKMSENKAKRDSLKGRRAVKSNRTQGEQEPDLMQ